jgi:hypothetical protein
MSALNLSPRSATRLSLIFSLLAPFGFALLALFIGKDASWDFQNYHFYNPYAFLTGRFGLDIAMGHHATYYNPLIDIPFFLMTQHLPDWVAGFFLASIQGLNCVLMFWLAQALLQKLEPPLMRLSLCVLVALTAMSGGGALSQLGTVAYDNVVSLGVLASLCLIAWHWEQINTGLFRSVWPRVLLAGFLAGSAAGLKLTATIYAVGLCVAFFCTSGTFGRRFSLAFVFGVGVLAGMTLFAGYWSLMLWRETGNPFFPYFNDLFHSPLVSTNFNRDRQFIPDTFLEKVVFPFSFTRNPLLTSDFIFHDIRILMLSLLLPAGCLLAFLRRGAMKERLWQPGMPCFILLAAAVSYLVWLQIFCIYRYITLLEMLAPLLFALCLDMFPISRRSKVIGLVLLLILSQAAVQGLSFRGSWDGRYVQVRVPSIPRPLDSMVLATGYAPMSYVIPSFPSRIPFLRIQGWMTNMEGEEENGLDRRMKKQVATFDGDLYVLFATGDTEANSRALLSYHLQIDRDSCQLITSNIAEALHFCKLQRME